MPDRKTCSECGCTKSLDDFYRNAAGPDGRHTKCKACIQARQASYRRENADRIHARRTADRDKEREQLRRWYERNPNRDAEYYKAHKEQRAATSRRWYQENKRKRAEASKRWAQANRDKINQYSKIRRGSLNGGDYDRSLAREYVGIISSDPCVYCGGPTSEIDHIQPVFYGGAGCWSNLAPTCQSCNRTKGTRSVLWMLAYRLSA